MSSFPWIRKFLNITILIRDGIRIRLVGRSVAAQLVARLLIILIEFFCRETFKMTNLSNIKFEYRKKCIYIYILVRNPRVAAESTIVRR
ncbi:hypothetical protein Hanom_Chr02g00160861 [Helianthus anomalus]